MPRSSREEAERTRERIVHALFQLAKECDWVDVTISAICKRANLGGRSTVNAHYPRKAQMWAAILPETQRFIDEHYKGETPLQNLLAAKGARQLLCNVITNALTGGSRSHFVHLATMLSDGELEILLLSVVYHVETN